MNGFSSDHDRRLSNIENKLDGVISALNKLAALEEKHLSVARTLTRHEDRINVNDNRLRDLEMSASAQTQMTKGHAAMLSGFVSFAAAALVLIGEYFLIGK